MRTLLTLISLCPALVADQQVLLVLLKGASALGFYSMEGQPIAKVPVGLHPHEMVLSVDGRYAFITDNGVMRIENAGKGGNTVSVVDLHQRKRVDTIGGFGRLRRPHGIAIDPPTGRLAVTVESPVSGMFLLDGNKRSKMKVLETNGETSHMVVFGPGKSGAEHAYVSNAGSNDVSVVQLTTGGELKKIPTGKRPEGLVLSPNGKELYVCNRDSDMISIIDTERRAALGQFRTGKGPVRIGATPDGRMLVYACMYGHYIEFADVETRRPVARVPVDGEPISLSLSKDGKLAFAAVEEKDTVYVISVAERKVLKSFQVEKGGAPDPVVLANLP